VANRVGTDLIPEAAIINFYPLNSTMGGHLDDAEHNLERPIVSFSIGRSAIFLIGGKTKLEEAIPLFLKSGDAIVMSGDSRLCYHGVPSIIPENVELHLTGQSGTTAIFDASKEDQETYKYVAEYLKDNRINMNSRQVRSGTEWVEKAGTGCVKV
jgi:alkylated DNA repair protein alkB family protein 1